MPLQNATLKEESVPFTFQLSSEEKALLYRILTDQLGTLREGVYHSDTYTFTDELRKERELLKSLLEKLS